MKEQGQSSELYKCPQKRAYNKISEASRKRLVMLVMQKGMAIAKAARCLNLNHSTAKVIVRNYKKALQKKDPEQTGNRQIQPPNETQKQKAQGKSEEKRPQQIPIVLDPVQNFPLWMLYPCEPYWIFYPTVYANSLPDTIL